MDLKKQIERVKKYQEYYEEIMNALGIYNTNPNILDNLKDKIEELDNYYTNGGYMEDYEADENNLIPTELNREILTEDSLYDMFIEIDKIYKKQ